MGREGTRRIWGIFLEICVTVVSGEKKVYNQKNEHIFEKRGGVNDIECEPKDRYTGLLFGLVLEPPQRRVCFGEKSHE